MQFMAPFCRRGALREGEELVFTRQAIGSTDDKDLTPEEIKEKMKEDLMTDFKLKLVEKQN